VENLRAKSGSGLIDEKKKETLVTVFKGFVESDNF
jgi:hypothetical protein